jgi:hypothetical protein
LLTEPPSLDTLKATNLKATNAFLILLKASKSETIEYRRRKGSNDDVEIIIQITKQEEVLMPLALNRFFTCSKLRALSSSASVVFLRDTFSAWVVQGQSQCSIKRHLNSTTSLVGGSQVFKAHLAPYKAKKEENVEFLTDKMQDPYF